MRRRFLVIGLALLGAGLSLGGLAVSRGATPPSTPLPPGYTEIHKRQGDAVIRIQIPPRPVRIMPHANPPNARYAR